MSKAYITVGCPTTGGGEVISGHANFKHHGIPIALVGDLATCPKHNTVAVIVNGDPYMSYHGKAVARQGDSLSCGCQLLLKQNTFVRGSDGGNGNLNATNLINADENSNFTNDNEQFDEQIRLEDINGEPYSNVDYVVTFEDGTTLKGRTDSDGNTERLITEQAKKILTIDLYVDSNCNQSCSCEA